MKRLLFVVNVDWFFLSHRLPIAIKAIQRGYEVHIACTYTDKKTFLESLGIHCHNVPFSRSGSALAGEVNSIVLIRNLIKKVKPDLVHAVTIKPVLYTGFALQTLADKPAFVAAISGLGYVFTADTMRARLTRLIVSTMYKIALKGGRKNVIFQNTSDELILTEIVKLKASDKTLIKGSGADLSVYTPQNEPQTITKIVSMACRLLREKGVYQFVDAARIVKNEHPNTEFWLIGSVDPDNPNSVTQKEVDQWVEEGVISALGHRDDIPTLFSQSHIVTLPSFYGEGVPKVLIEAAACGRPIVTTDNPGCRDAIIDGVTGLKVPVKDAVRLAEAYMRLLDDDRTRCEMGRSAREYAIQEFDVNNVVTKHMDIYQELMVPSR